jgi:hypothetical protein
MNLQGHESTGTFLLHLKVRLVEQAYPLTPASLFIA